MTDWFAGSRATSPALVRMLPSESRYISIGLSSSLASGETIQAGGIVASLREWRTSVDAPALALVGPVTYNTSTKVASQRIDASQLDLGESYRLEISFNVNGALGVERRAAYVVVMVTR